MKIEAGLSDADDARLRRERREFVRRRLGVIGRFVRMHTDRTPDIGMGFGDRAHRRKSNEAHTYGLQSRVVLVCRRVLEKNRDSRSRTEENTYVLHLRFDLV